MSSILSSRGIKVILLLVGMVTLGGLVIHIGPERIYRTGMSLGAVGLMIMRYLGEPIDIVTALSIDALTTFIKGGTFFVPGSIGAQEAGTLMLLRAYGYSDVTGMTFALLRRVRELIWIGVGVLCLAFLMQAERLSERRNRC